MVTKGIIIDKASSNSWNVRIPIFETSSSKENQIFECYYCLQNNNNPSFVKGDIVVIDFLDNNLNSPIIMGYFYKGNIVENNNKNYDNEINKINRRLNSIDLNNSGSSCALYKHIFSVNITDYNIGMETEITNTLKITLFLPIETNLQTAIIDGNIKLSDIFNYYSYIGYDNSGYVYLVYCDDVDNLSETNSKNRIIYLNRGIRTGANYITNINIKEDDVEYVSKLID